MCVHRTKAIVKRLVYKEQAVANYLNEANLITYNKTFVVPSTLFLSSFRLFLNSFFVKCFLFFFLQMMMYEDTNGILWLMPLLLRRW